VGRNIDYREVKSVDFGICVVIIVRKFDEGYDVNKWCVISVENAVFSCRFFRFSVGF